MRFRKLCNQGQPWFSFMHWLCSIRYVEFLVLVLFKPSLLEFEVGYHVGTPSMMLFDQFACSVYTF